MRPFALSALKSHNPLFSRQVPGKGSRPSKPPPKIPRQDPSRILLKRMSPDTPAAQLDKRSATRLRNSRCLFHPLREAAARCPHCGGTYCRECVTDEEGKLACPPCLRRMAHPPARKASLARLFRESLAGLTAFAFLAALFFGLLRWRMNTPEQHFDFGRVVEDRLSTQSHD